jgi:hypothetical protein
VTRFMLWAVRREDSKVLAEDPEYFTMPRGTQVLTRLERARAAERSGQREHAARDYRYVAEAWRHADPQLQPYVAEARGALERLTQEQ